MFVRLAGNGVVLLGAAAVAGVGAVVALIPVREGEIIVPRRGLIVGVGVAMVGARAPAVAALIDVGGADAAVGLAAADAPNGISRFRLSPSSSLVEDRLVTAATLLRRVPRLRYY